MSLVNYPTIRPSLILDFQKAEVVDPRITFTRATTATRFNSYGVLESVAVNAPRIDFDPSTLISRGLLIEEQRTNVITFSEQLDNPAWTTFNVTVSANAAISPAGTMTADNIIPSASSTNFKEMQQNFSATSGTTYTFSFFAKSNGYRYIQVIGTNASFGTFAINYDLDTGTETQFAAGTSTVLQKSITSVGNGWYKVSASVTAIGTSVNSRLSCDIIPASDSVRGVTWTGDGTSGVLLWGLQIEAGAFATSYIPTTTTALTRNADVASMTGTNFSSWFNASEGTFVSQAQFTNVVSFNTVYDVNDGTTSNRIRTIQWNDGTNRRLSVTDGGLTQASIAGTGGIDVFKFGSAYKANDFAACQNGGAVGTDTAGTVPSVNQMGIGCYGPVSPTFFLNGYIQRIAYYPTRLPNTTLQALTA